MYKKIYSYIVTLGAFGLSISQFYTHQYIVAVPLLVYAITRLHDLNRVQQIIRETLEPADVERKANLEILLRMNIEEIVKHTVIKDLFAKLPREKTGCDTSEQFAEHLLQNYKGKYNTELKWHAVTFNLKNGLLFKNGTPYFLDTIFEEVEIPYQLTGKNPWRPSIEDTLCIRFLIVNGSLNLEVGCFDKERSPIIYKDSALAIYKDFERITSFPMIFCGSSFGLPLRYLNPTFEATTLYKSKYLLTDGAPKKIKPIENDWMQLHQNLRIYSILVADSESPLAVQTSYSGYVNLVKDFLKKGRSWLIKEKFLDPNEKPDTSDFDPWEDTSTYENKFMEIRLSDWSATLDRFKNSRINDYWEERP